MYVNALNSSLYNVIKLFYTEPIETLLVSMLQVPEMLTTVDQRFQCCQCGAVYMSKAHCKRHVMNIHVNPMNHICPICKRRFSYHDNLKSHIKVHHMDHVTANKD